MLRLAQCQFVDLRATIDIALELGAAEHPVGGSDTTGMAISAITQPMAPCEVRVTRAPPEIALGIANA